MAAISFPRGNSANICIKLKVNGAEYTLADGETALFTVKERKEKGTPIKIQKHITSENYNADEFIVVAFEPDDTVDWKTGEDGKEYYWDFAVKLSDNKFYTPITEGVLILLPALGSIGDVYNGE